MHILGEEAHDKEKEIMRLTMMDLKEVILDVSISDHDPTMVRKIRKI